MRYHRLHTAMLCLVLCLAGVYAATAATELASIHVETDGSTYDIDVSGGGVGYPGPNSVEIGYDSLGMVVVTRVRFFGVYGERVFVPVVAR